MTMHDFAFDDDEDVDDVDDADAQALCHPQLNSTLDLSTSQKPLT